VVFSEEAFAESQAVVYHHSIGSDMTAAVRRFEKSKALIYHNITPAEFYDEYSPKIAAMLRRGRDGFSEMAPDFPLALGVSRYNAAELEAIGFNEPGVLPLCIDPARFAEPDPVTLEALSDGRTNILFVGQTAPHKKQDDLIRAFRRYLELDRGARLILIGGCAPDNPYSVALDELVRSLGIEDSVLRPGFVSEAQLVASYQTAHLFWSMSEHEGFCVPLIEAMWFDVPVFAYDSTAVPETLGDAGELCRDKRDPAALAKRAHQLVHDAELRKRVIGAQRKRRSDFGLEKFIPALEQLAKQLCSRAMPPVRQHVRV
jgi:glycosyltransferase involved in cell wall biosynthesis